MHVHEYAERTWRHLDSCQFKTVIRARVPLVRCPEHGDQQVQVPWAEKYGRFTKLFERLAIDLMGECSISAACEILRISWDEADGIKQRAVRRGLKRRQVWHVSDGRDTASLDQFWRSLAPEQIQSVQCVCMDMHEPYRNSTQTHLPDAAQKIAHDPFHIAQHMNEALDAVRKQEHQQLLEMDDDRLSGTKWHWLVGEENVPLRVQEQFQFLKAQTLKTARAWSIKEMLRDFWRCPQADAEDFFDRWYSWAIRDRLEPVKKVARMIKRRIEQVLNFFKYRLSNASLEGLNNRIQGLIKKAYGYRNRERFKTDIMFHLGGLDLYPSL